MKIGQESPRSSRYSGSPTKRQHFTTTVGTAPEIQAYSGHYDTSRSFPSKILQREPSQVGVRQILELNLNGLLTRRDHGQVTPIKPASERGTASVRVLFVDLYACASRDAVRRKTAVAFLLSTIEQLHPPSDLTTVDLLLAAQGVTEADIASLICKELHAYTGRRYDVVLHSSKRGTKKTQVGLAVFVSWTTWFRMPTQVSGAPDSMYCQTVRLHHHDGAVLNVVNIAGPRTTDWYGDVWAAVQAVNTSAQDAVVIGGEFSATPASGNALATLFGKLLKHHGLDRQAEMCYKITRDGQAWQPATSHALYNNKALWPVHTWALYKLAAPVKQPIAGQSLAEASRVSDSDVEIASILDCSSIPDSIPVMFHTLGSSYCSLKESVHQNRRRVSARVVPHAAFLRESVDHPILPHALTFTVKSLWKRRYPVHILAHPNPTGRK
jgi:hypothetical protein